MKDKLYTWKYCATCDKMTVLCTGCGNNVCNSGGNCPECESSRKYMKENEAPPKPDNWKELFKKEHLAFREMLTGEIDEEDIEWAEKIIEKREKSKNNKS